MNRSKTRKPQKILMVYYDGFSVNGTQLTRDQVTKYPYISFKPKKGKLYTLVMYDLYSPNPSFLHMLAINITDPKSMHPIVPYLKPSPPVKDTHYHVYLFELYEQPEFLTLDESFSDRSGFNADKFSKKYGLHKVAQRGFFMNPQLIL